MMDFVICVTTNLFRLYIIYRCICTFLGKSEDGLKKELLAYAFFFATNTILFWEYHTAWINLLSNIVGIALVIWIHTKSVHTIVFLTSAIYVVNMACDVIGTVLFIQYKDGEVHSQIYAAIGVFLIFICELITERIVKYKENEKIPHNLSLIVIPIASVVMVCVLVYTNSCEEIGLAVICMGLLLINFFMFYLYNQLLGSVIQKYENEMLKRKVVTYSNQLQIMLKSDEAVKELRHDMKHHMNEISILASKHEVPEIQNYISNMQDFLTNPQEIVVSGNGEIDSVLNYMLAKARAELKTVNVKVSIQKEIEHSFDINVLLGNLLENAIEAANQTEEKMLDVEIKQNQGILKVKIENSYIPDKVSFKSDENGITAMETTKTEKEGHGIGLKSVKAILEANHGTIEVMKNDGIFTVSLLMYLEKK